MFTGRASLIWSITDNGLAKATAIEEYPLQGRYGQGVINLRLPEDGGSCAGACRRRKYAYHYNDGNRYDEEDTPEGDVYGQPVD